MSRSAHYTLFLLCALAVLCYIDRMMLSILMEPIRKDLHLTDTMLGALGGLSFAIFYCTFAFPIARWGDRGDRSKILALCALVWSIATAACGLATNYIQLVVARIGVAIGESGATPVSQALIVDLYPPERRARALSILAAANAIGVGLGLGLIGWLATLYHWRTVFMIVAVPGVIFAILTYFTGKEPRKDKASPLPIEPALNFMDALRTVLRIPGLLWIMGVAAATSITGLGLLTWTPSFLMRVHGMSIQNAGMWMGLTTIIGLVLGSLASGWVSDWAGKRDVRWYTWISAGGLLAAFPATVAFVLWPTPMGALLFFLLLKFLMSLYMPALYSLALSLAPSNVRAMTSAMIGLAVNLAGAGIGPLLIGGISDYLQPRYGEFSLRYALVAVSVGLVIAAVCALFAGRRLHRGAMSAKARAEASPL